MTANALYEPTGVIFRLQRQTPDQRVEARAMHVNDFSSEIIRPSKQEVLQRLTQGGADRQVTQMGALNASRFVDEAFCKNHAYIFL